MLKFLETLKEQHSDDESLIAINQIESELTSKKYGLVWEEHEEEVDVKMRTHIPVFTEVEEKEIVGNPDSEQYNFLLEGDNLHSLKLLEKTHKGIYKGTEAVCSAVQEIFGVVGGVQHTFCHTQHLFVHGNNTHSANPVPDRRR